MQKIDYPEDFAERVRQEFPDDQDLLIQGLLIALRDDLVILGRYLDNAQSFSVRPSTIVRLFAQGRERELLEAAEQALRRQTLYREWGRLYNAALNKEEEA